MRSLLLVLLLCGCETHATFSSKPNTSRVTPPPVKAADPPATPAVTTSAVELRGEYDANVLKADAKHKDKWIQVIGRVEAIKQDSQGRNYLGFGSAFIGASSWKAYERLSPKEKKWFNEGVPPTVICYLHPSHLSHFAELKKDQMATVIGRCRGSRNDPEAWNEYVVILENCIPGKHP